MYNMEFVEKLLGKHRESLDRKSWEEVSAEGSGGKRWAGKGKWREGPGGGGAGLKRGMQASPGESAARSFPQSRGSQRRSERPEKQCLRPPSARLPHARTHAYTDLIVVVACRTRQIFAPLSLADFIRLFDPSPVCLIISQADLHNYFPSATPPSVCAELWGDPSSLFFPSSRVNERIRGDRFETRLKEQTPRISEVFLLDHCCSKTRDRTLRSYTLSLPFLFLLLSPAFFFPPFPFRPLLLGGLRAKALGESCYCGGTLQAMVWGPRATLAWKQKEAAGVPMPLAALVSSRNLASPSEEQWYQQQQQQIVPEERTSGTRRRRARELFPKLLALPCGDRRCSFRSSRGSEDQAAILWFNVLTGISLSKKEAKLSKYIFLWLCLSRRNNS